MLKKRFNSLVFLSMTLVGCASSTISPTTEVRPIAFSQNNSYALNVANQSYLRQPYKWGLKTWESPLKDFTKDEIHEIKTALENKASNAGFVGAAVGLAMGNLMWATIDATGGVLEHWTISNHIAVRPNWVIAVDASMYKDGVEANMSANRLIEKAILETLRDKGNILNKAVMKEEGKATFGGKIYGRTAYVLGEERKTSFGLISDDYLNKNPMLLGKTNLIEADSQYVTAWDTASLGLGSIVLFTENKIKGYSGIEGYEQYVKDVTGKLPEGFYYYMPSFPKTGYRTVEHVEDWSCNTCGDTHQFQMTSMVVPAIYTRGQKFEFIKPSM